MVVCVQAVDSVVVVRVDFGVHVGGGLDVALAHPGFGHGVEKAGVHAAAPHHRVGHNGVDDDGLDHEQNAQVAGGQVDGVAAHAVGLGAAAGVALEQSAQGMLAAGVQAHHVGEQVALIGHDDHTAAVAGQLLFQGRVGGIVHIQAGRAFFLEKGDFFLELEHGFLQCLPLGGFFAFLVLVLGGLKGFLCQLLLQLVIELVLLIFFPELLLVVLDWAHHLVVDTGFPLAGVGHHQGVQSQRHREFILCVDLVPLLQAAAQQGQHGHAHHVHGHLEARGQGFGVGGVGLGQGVHGEGGALDLLGQGSQPSPLGADASGLGVLFHALFVVLIVLQSPAFAGIAEVFAPFQTEVGIVAHSLLHSGHGRPLLIGEFPLLAGFRVAEGNGLMGDPVCVFDVGLSGLPVLFLHGQGRVNILQAFLQGLGLFWRQRLVVYVVGFHGFSFISSFSAGQSSPPGSGSDRSRADSQRNRKRLRRCRARR